MVLSASIVLIVGSDLEPSTESEPAKRSTADVLLHNDYYCCRNPLTASVVIIHICEPTEGWAESSFLYCLSQNRQFLAVFRHVKSLPFHCCCSFSPPSTPLYWLNIYIRLMEERNTLEVQKVLRRSFSEDLVR